MCGRLAVICMSDEESDEEAVRALLQQEAEWAQRRAVRTVTAILPYKSLPEAHPYRCTHFTAGRCHPPQAPREVVTNGDGVQREPQPEPEVAHPDVRIVGARAGQKLEGSDAL